MIAISTAIVIAVGWTATMLLLILVCKILEFIDKHSKK